MNQANFDQMYGLSRQITDYFVETKNTLEQDVMAQEKEANLVFTDSEKEVN